MIFDTTDLTEVTFGDVSYPIKCDLFVMDKIQDKYGDLIRVEDKLRGFEPRVDSDGVIDRTIGNWTLPPVSMTLQILLWMMEEGREITKSDIELPSLDDLKRQEELSLSELGVIVFREYEYGIAGGKKKVMAQKQEQSKKTATKTAKTKR